MLRVCVAGGKIGPMLLDQLTAQKNPNRKRSQKKPTKRPAGSQLTDPLKGPGDDYKQPNSARPCQ